MKNEFIPYRIIHQAPWLCKAAASGKNDRIKVPLLPSGRRSTFAIFQTAAAKKTLKSHALDAAADSAQLFLNAAISALDVPAGVVHQRFALGAEPG